MKMKKFFAAVLAVVMVLAVVTGCSKGSGKASADAQKGMEVSLAVKYTDSDNNADFTVKSFAVGKESVVSLNGSIKTGGQSLNVNGDRMLVLSNNKVYINVKSILNALSAVSSGTDISGTALDSVKEYVKEDYVYVDLSDMKDYLNEVDPEFAKDSFKNFIDAFKDIAEVDEKDSVKTYVVTCKSNDDMLKVVEVLKKYFSDNKEAWVNLSYEQYSKVDIDDVMDKVADMVVSAMGYDESMSEMLKKQILANIDTSDYEVSKDELASSFDKVEELLDSYSSGDVDFEGEFTLKITSSDDKAYSLSLEGKGSEEDQSVSISYAVDTEATGDLSAPDKAQNVSDVISDLVKGLSSAE